MIKSENYITDEVRKAAEQEALANLMNVFSDKMFEKIMKKFQDGYSGWDNPISLEIVKEKLVNNINAKDWIDVAVLSMFLWNLSQPDSVPPVPPGPTNQVFIEGQKPDA